jgi:putative nucleotidyltransferase with HDIG domain
VLRVANSASYASSEPIVSLPHAVSRFGFTALSQIAYAVAVGGRVFQVRGHEAWVAEMWRHAALAGGWARELARVRRRNVEGGFLCGLLHDVGKPVLLQTAIDALARHRATAARAELEPVLAQMHERTGALLARRWKMAPWIAAAIESHHAPVGAAGSPVAPGEDALAAQLADLLAHWSEEHGNDDQAAALASWQTWPASAALNLYADDLAALFARGAKVREFAGALS